MYQIFNAQTGHWVGWSDEPVSGSPKGTFAIAWPPIPEAAEGVYWCDPTLRAKVVVIPYKPSLGHDFDGEKWILSDSVIAERLADSRLIKLAELNTAAQVFIDNAAKTADVPEFERQSWNLQAIEAKAWAADENADTPILNRIALSRGIKPDTLKAAALRKALAYEQIVAHVAGQRQALHHRIEQASDVDTLAAIEIFFTLAD